MKPPYSRIPAVFPALALVAGILLQSIKPCVEPWSVAIAIASLCLAAIAVIRRRFYVALATSFIALGWWIAHISEPTPPSENVLGKHRISAIVKKVDESRGYTRLKVKVIATIDSNTVVKIEKPFLCNISTTSTDATLWPGDTIALDAEIKPVESKPGLPHQPDYARYQLLNGITASGTCYSGLVDVTGRASGIEALINRLRASLVNDIVDAPLSPATSSFLLATVIGDTGYIDPETINNFRTAGLAHVLAISGLHVGIIVWILALALFPIRVFRFNRVRFVVVAMAVWVYAAVVGMTPSVTRAAVMVTVLMLTRLLQRDSSGFNSLAVAVVVILLADPNAIYLPGFQMSVCAVASILFFTPIMLPDKLRRLPFYFVLELVAVPIAAMIGTGIISVAWFNRFPVAFLFTNIIVAVILPIMMIAAAAIIACTLCNLQCQWLGNIVDSLYNAVEDVAQSFANASWASVDGIFVDAPAIVAYFACVISAALWTKLKKHIYATFFIASLALFFGIIITVDRHCPQAEAYLLNTRQSTDIIVRNGNRAWLLSTADSSAAAQLCKSYTERYSRYLLYNRCNDTLSLLSVQTSQPPVNYHGNHLCIGDKTLAIIATNDALPTDSSKTTYALICKGFTADVVDRAMRFRADTVLLSADINARRARRYQRECSIAALPVRNLRNAPPFKIATDN